MSSFSTFIKVFTILAMLIQVRITPFDTLDNRTWIFICALLCSYNASSLIVNFANHIKSEKD